MIEGRGQITFEDKTVNVTKTVYFFNHTCKFQPVINLKKMIFQRIPFTKIWGCKSDIT